ncbi:MAG TPA: shikimate dehydrogenase [Acidimicrobiales bacterium]|nr:shikimate dehydrogenase [Acidimicrobiales bacterium]
MPGRRSLLSAPTGASRVAGVIGDPVAHSLSPVLHNAAFAATGIDWVYVAFHVAAGQAAAAVEAVRTLDLAGLSVTMPHKADAAGAVDQLGPTAARLGVINTVSWAPTGTDATLFGESTDGSGFLDSLRGDEGFDPAGRPCVVLGAGGAARAVSLALAGAGAQVTVVGRRADATVSCAELAGGRHVVVGAAEPTSEPGSGLRDAVTECELLVNATPVGMAGQPGLPFGLDPDWLRKKPFVADLIYAPATPPLLMAARSVGAPGCNGLGMLIHQAARQFEMWTGRPAPLEAMSAAAVATLTHHDG